MTPPEKPAPPKEPISEQDTGSWPTFTRDWETAVDSMDDLLLLVSRTGRVVRGNRALSRWQLGTVRRVPGRNFHRLLHPGCAGDCYLQELWRRALEPEVEPGSRIERGCEDQQLERWIHASLDVLNFAYEEPPAESGPFAMLVLRDTSEIRRQKELEGRRTRFEALHLVVRGLAHEIGNPLAAMRTTVEVLQDNMNRFDEEKVQVYLERILDGTRRLEAILDRTARSHQLPEPRIEPIDLALLCERMRGLYEDDMTGRGIVFRVEAPPANKKVYLDADLLAAEEVLVNVLRNAMEASKRGCKVRMEHDDTGKEIFVTITDDGRGMTSEQLRTLFHPFFSSKPGGMGIGLSYSNYLMVKMGGEISVESQAGRGTRVTLRFQRATPQKKGRR